MADETAMYISGEKTYLNKARKILIVHFILNASFGVLTSLCVNMASETWQSQNFYEYIVALLRWKIMFYASNWL